MSDPAPREWRRLDTRMLLVHPVTELIRFFPALLGVAILGGRNGPDWWQAVAVAVPIALGLLRWLTTGFRITGGQLELRRGLLTRTVVTAPLDRVRTVELTASPIHRVLGLASVVIGTGADRRAREQLTLDSLGVEEARRMRSELLHRSTSVAEPGAGPGTESGVGADAEPGDQVLMRLDPGWVRYAPLSTSGIALAVGTVAAAGHSGWALTERLADRVDIGLDRAIPAVLLGAALLVVLLAVSVLAVLGYLVGNWGFVLSRDAAGRSYHARRGLLTSRETSIDTGRLRGVEIREPLSLRLASGGELAAVMTGLDRGETGSALLVPPAPRPVVDRVAAAVLGTDHPLSMPLHGHGPRATRRRWTRALAIGVPLAIGYAVVLGLLGVAPLGYAGAVLLIAGTAVLARDRARRLGHGLTERHLVFRGHSLAGRRDVLDRAGVIGWNLRQSWFQRRAGLVTMEATTAAGRQGYPLLDVPEDDAVALLAAVDSDGVLAPFLSRS